jgi:anthranilate phosphoribosyltransferase
MMDFDMTKNTFKKLFEGKMSEIEAKELLVGLYHDGESAEEIAAAAAVMREYAVKLPVSEALQAKLIDNCGTGGDKSNSFNVSTTVSLLLSAAGCSVAKHGNRSITSKSGSADMLEVLDINLSLSLQAQVTMLEEVGFTFMFAQNHHPAMKHIMPIRKSLSHRTIFNILGPLTNPAGVKKQLIGVFSDDYIHRISSALKILGTENALVVSSKDGMDEISICDVTYATQLKEGRSEDIMIDPAKLGLQIAPKEAIIGGDARENAKITQGVLSGEIKDAKRDIVLINAAAALIVDRKARDFQDGLEIAREVIDSAKAKRHLNKIVELSKKLS